MDDGGFFYVLIFEDQGGGEGRSRFLAETIKIGPDLEEAREAALDEARTYKPEHPTFEQDRWVFQTSPNTWVVQLKGAVSHAHIEVQVGQLVAVGDYEDEWPDV